MHLTPLTHIQQIHASFDPLYRDAGLLAAVTSYGVGALWLVLHRSVQQEEAPFPVTSEWLAADTAKPRRQTRCFRHLPGKLSALIRAGRQTGSSQAFGWREARSCSEGAGFEPHTTGMARDYDHLFKLLIIGDSGKRRRGCVTGSGPARGSGGGFECLVWKLWALRRL